MVKVSISSIPPCWGMLPVLYCQVVDQAQCSVRPYCLYSSILPRQYGESINFTHSSMLWWSPIGTSVRRRGGVSVHHVSPVLRATVIYGSVVNASEGIISQSQSVMCNKRSWGRGSIFLAPSLPPSFPLSAPFSMFSLTPHGIAVENTESKSV